MEKLVKLADDEGVFISYQDLVRADNKKLFGVYSYDPERDVPLILLDHSLKHNRALHRSVLAEELGHYFTVPQGNFLLPYTSCSRALTLGRDERRALNWACNFLMPIITFRNAIGSGLHTVEELAEHFNVTPWLVYRRVEFARAKCSDMDEWCPIV